MERTPSLFFSMLSTCFLLTAPVAFAQSGPPDSTYLRIPLRAEALAAMRFDLNAYGDTLRRYRDALEHSAYRVDASSKEGESRQAQIGLLRDDVKKLDKDMKRLRKLLKRTPPTTEDAARACGELVWRTRHLRTRLVGVGVFPRQ